MIGRNGMGKTTLCNTLMGLVRPTAGEVVFNGERVEDQVPEKIAKHGVVVRAAGSAAVPVADRRRAPDDARARARGASDGRPKAVYELFPRLAERRRNGGGSCREASSRCSPSVARCC